MKRLFLFLFLCGSLLSFLFAQDPKAFKYEKWEEKHATKTLYLFRYFDKQEQEIGSWFTDKLFNCSDAIKYLALPPDSKANFLEIVKIPIGTPFFYGEVASGIWVTIKDKNGLNNLEFINSMDSWYESSKSKVNESSTIPIVRSGGAPQYYIKKEYIKKENIVKTIDLGLMPKNSIYNLEFDSKKCDFVMLETKKRNTIIDVYNNPDKINIDVKKYGRFPGGIIIDSTKAIIKKKISSVEYDVVKNMFKINDKYYYEINLDKDIMASIYNVIFNSESDITLGALSQSKIIGVSEDDKLAKLLSDADTRFGLIIYGYDLCGNYAIDKEMPQGYKNPEIESMSLLEKSKPDDNNVLLRLAQKETISSSFRVYLKYKDITFSLDTINNIFEPISTNIAFNYQFFNESHDSILFTDKKDNTYYNYYEYTINQFKTKYNQYEDLFPDFLQAKKVASLYAFFLYLKSNGINIKNNKKITNIYNNRDKTLGLYYMYNILPSSDCFKYKQWLLNRIDKVNIDETNLSNEDKLIICYCGYRCALNTYNFEQIKKYRRRCLKLIAIIFHKEQISNSNAGIISISDFLDFRNSLLIELYIITLLLLLSLCITKFKRPIRYILVLILLIPGCNKTQQICKLKQEDIVFSLEYQTPNNIYYLFEFADKYKEIKDISNYAYKKVIDFYMESAKIQNSIGDNYGLASDYNNTGDIIYEMDNFQQAIYYYNRSIKVLNELVQSNDSIEAKSANNRIAACYNKISICNRMQNDSIKAMENINLAIQYNSDKPKYYYSRALLFMDNKNYEKSIDDWNKYIFSSDVNSKEIAYLYRGVCKLNTYDLSSGCEDFRSAEKLVSDNLTHKLSAEEKKSKEELLNQLKELISKYCN